MLRPGKNDGVDIADFELHPKAESILRSIGVHTLGDLRAVTEHELSQMPNLGRKHINEIKEIMAFYGVRLSDYPPSADRFRLDFSNLIVGYDAPVIAHGRA